MNIKVFTSSISYDVARMITLETMDEAPGIFTTQVRVLTIGFLNRQNKLCLFLKLGVSTFE